MPNFLDRNFTLQKSLDIGKNPKVVANGDGKIQEWKSSVLFTLPFYIEMTTDSFKAIGFEMLYQESKNRQNTHNLSVDGMKSSVCELLQLSVNVLW